MVAGHHVFGPNLLEVHVWEIDGVDIHALNGLHGLLCRALSLPSYQVSCTRRQFGYVHCGAASVLFLSTMVLQEELVDSLEKLQFASENMRAGFRPVLCIQTLVLGTKTRFGHRPDCTAATAWCPV